MDYKGNLKGDALKHFKWKGRRKSTNVIKAGGPNSRRRVEFEKEQQKKGEMKAAEQKRRERAKAQQKRRDQEMLEKERRDQDRRANARKVSNEYLEESDYNSKKNQFPKKPAENPAKKASKEDGFVKVKAFIRKLANGTIINVRSFLRRVAKKLGK